MESYWMCVIALIAMLTGPCSPLSCWECDSDCEDPANHVEEKCDSNTQHCLMIRLEGEKSLSCAPDPPTPGQEGCREKGGTVQCFCDTELCNSGEGLGGGVVLLGLAALVAGLAI
eukprot:GFUD01052346.1.p1 GENE.GFUD01052346.1~~GFUD01052346.1.p1  ORF type:complete len:115 (-),score=33.63 GFUD01052346.1:239-583(-)